jgi:proteic killer suppression protein
MIKDFKCKETEKIFQRLRSRKFSSEVQRIALRKLLVLDAAEAISDLRIPPSNRLEKLGGNLRGQFSIRINDQWRLCFKWKDGDAFGVEVIDYH